MTQIQVFRIQKIKHNPTLLSGIGASRVAGRWNYLNRALIYASESGALAILEYLANIGNPALGAKIPSNIAVMELPEECIHTFALDDLPPCWNDTPSTDCARAFVAPYLDSAYKLAYRVPSVINVYETNVLIDPLHPDIVKVNILRFDPYSFDNRLIKCLSTA